MKLNTYEAPHIRHHESTAVLMVDGILAMIFIYGMAFFYYGPRALMLGLVSVGAAVISDALCRVVARRPQNIRDLSSVVTGLLIPLLMPASIDYQIVVVAAVFGIAVAKHPFGGTGHNVFNPAAAGLAFVTICFPAKLFAYPLPLDWLPVFGPLTPTLGDSPAFTLALGGIPGYDLVEMLLGNFPGPMGATNILVVLACLLYLVLRNTVHWEMPVCFFAATALMAFLFPRAEGFDLNLAVRLRLTAYEMMAGVLLLGGGLMLGDPVTTAKRDSAKVAFAILAGVLTMLFRHFGRLESSLPFAVLLLNASVWGFDMAAERLASRRRHKKIARTGADRP